MHFGDYHCENLVKPTLISIYQNDKNTKVRANSLRIISANYKGSELNTLYESALNEQSYAIVAQGLNALAAENPILGMQKAKALENEPAKE